MGENGVIIDMRDNFYLKRNLAKMCPLYDGETVEPAIDFVIRTCWHYKACPADPQKINSLVVGSLDRLQERLNIGNWKEVSIGERRAITLLSFYKVLTLVQLNGGKDIKPTREICEAVDHGLLFGAPLPPPNENLLHDCLNLFQDVPESERRSAKLPKFINPTLGVAQTASRSNQNEYGTPVDVECLPSIESFYERMRSARPLALQGCIGDWPALTLWNDPNYLIERAGRRTVPIEIGSKYTDSNWTQKLVTFADFVRDFVINVEGKEIGYLAQHELFNQIPSLLNDFSVPDYCALHLDDESNDTIDKNAWFGPCGTVSPLHTDPKHNLLAQIVGEKLIILFSPEDTPYLYPHPDKMMQNTAQVDPIAPNYKLYPEFRKATPFFHILKRGEMLYIPPGWWHYVKSLSVSFSVSFWWK